MPKLATHPPPSPLDGQTELDDLRRAMAEAHARSEDLEDFLTHAVVPMHRVDRHGIIRWANHAELALLGYRADEYIGHHITEFHADRAAIEDILRRLGRGEVLRDYEARVRTRTGAVKVIELSSNVQRRGGEFVSTRCFSRDVTALKQAAHRTAALHELTAALSRALGPRDAGMIVIEQARAVIGAVAGSVLLLDGSGRAVDRVLIDGAHDREAAAKLAELPLDAELPPFHAARTGELVWVVGAAELDRRYPRFAALRAELGAQSWGAVPIRFEGRTLGAIGLRCLDARRLTADDEAILLALGRQCGQAFERARLHELSQIARAEAEQASRAKDEFLAILGHELRNPLSPILTAVQLMRLRGDVASAHEQHIIERQVQHLIHIVDDLLDISRVARGKIQLDKRPLRLAALITKALEITGPPCEERRHHVSVRMPDHDVWIEADETRMTQVITNLITNAAKYTPPGGRIELAVTARAGRVAIHVKDNGNGISPELVPQIFDLFVQGNRTSDRKQGGLGIGLALVRNLVRMHGGTVTARSAGLGRGSEFVVDLPMIDVRREPAPPPDTDADLRQRIRVTARRILVVDDNEDAGALLGEMLRSLGHEVAVAFDGPRALDALRHFTPEVAILDIGLPVIDGYELARTLRARFGPALLLIAVTGYGQEHDRRRALASGFDAHFVKPVTLQKVLAAIEVHDPGRA